MQPQISNYHITFEQEYNFWVNNVINKWIIVNYRCPNWNKDWMNDPSSGYHRIVHIHAQNNFGHAPQFTSYIESVWGDLKRLLSKIYVSVKSDNFIYFAK